MSLEIGRARYAAMYGPTAGDKVRLADTELFIEIEKDFTVYGEEAKFGGGKTIRDGMAQSATAKRADGIPDLVITSVMIASVVCVAASHRSVRRRFVMGRGPPLTNDTRSTTKV